MVQLSSLSKRFGERVLLDQVTWYVGDRDRVGLCGPNGAGKTTLLRMLAGFDEADGGVEFVQDVLGSGADLPLAALQPAFLELDAAHGLPHAAELSFMAELAVGSLRGDRVIEAHRQGVLLAPRARGDMKRDSGEEVVRLGELFHRNRIGRGHLLEDLLGLPEQMRCAHGISHSNINSRLIVEQSARQLANFFEASVHLMQVMARACGHDHLRKFTLGDLTTWKKEMSELSGVAFGGAL